MKHRLTKRVVVAFLIAIAIIGVAQPADAHPLGNFTVNRYARVEPSAGVVRVTYVLDEAEIPTFQEQKAINADRDGFARQRADEIGAGLKLAINGAATPLQRKQYLLSQPEGQGGLPLLRLSVIFEAPVSGSGTLDTATFADTNEPDRIGWREIVVKGVGNATIADSNAPSTDLTKELREYPANLIQAPLDLRQASFRFDPGTLATSAETLTSPAKGPTRADAGFSGLVRKVDPGPVALALLFVLALGFGAVHGLAPGHGKSVMAAYLVGTRGRPIDAVLLGVLVAIMHTGSVLVVGLLLLKLGSDVDIANAYPVLTLLSGLMVLALGVALVVIRLRGLLKARRQLPHAHDHVDLVHTHEEHANSHEVADLALANAGHIHSHVAHEDHGHSHALDHSHDHDHPYTHDHDHSHATGEHSHGFGKHSHDLPDGVAPLSRKGIALLATSGGLLPSPSAVIVLIGAATTGRLALGLGLIAAFSVGLAATLTAIGLALVYGRGFLERRDSKTAAIVLRALPVASACALLLAGTIVTVQGINELS